MCGKEMNNLDRRLVKISYGLLQCEFDICSKCSKKLKKFIYFDVQEITKGDVKMNDIKKPQNRTEATNVIYDLVKEFWGDCVSVKISASNSGIDFETREKPFTVDYSMKTINGNWLPRKDKDI